MADVNTNDPTSDDAGRTDVYRFDQRIASTREAITQFEVEVLEQIKTMFDDEASTFALRLALEEALTNAWRHGNAGDASKMITVRGILTPERVEVHVIDEGQGFDPDRVPDPTAAENLEIPSGRGLMLMRAYMTSVTHHPPGNHIELVLNRSAADGD